MLSKKKRDFKCAVLDYFIWSFNKMPVNFGEKRSDNGDNFLKKYFSAKPKTLNPSTQPLISFCHFFLQLQVQITTVCFRFRHLQLQTGSSLSPLFPYYLSRINFCWGFSLKLCSILNYNLLIVFNVS